MPKSGLNVALKGLDDLFSSEETRQEEQREQVQQIPVDELFPFKNHPFKVLDDDAMTRTVESISQFGVLAPLIARPRPEGGYKDNADTIVGNMDSQIFLGGSEPTTLKELSETLGKETIDSFNTSDTRGNSPSYGTSFQKLGHELMSRDELAVLDGGKCILQLRGVRPFLSDKYDLTQHPNYKLTSDYDPKNTFDIEKYLNRKEKIQPGDEFFVLDADSLPPI